ncbi:MAG: S-methyl-5-thioribose-1-phosphate isomerase [Candidatus Bathyarchaeia archaeon]
MRTIRWVNGVVETLDQTKLPNQEVFLQLKSPDEIVEAICNMRIRGAPLIGAAAALALAQTALRHRGGSRSTLLEALRNTAQTIQATRPTAVNLFNSVEKILAFAENAAEVQRGSLAEAVVNESLRFVESEADMSRALGRNGADLLADGDTILTHCNAGALATVEFGTALAVIRAARQLGKRIRVIATETRPLLQGARLTAYELNSDSIPVTLITDNAVGSVMQRKLVNKVIVGADRILTTGHVVNKIGTYVVASLAQSHQVPFYVAAPSTTLDLKSTIDQVVIEQRDPREVLEFQGRRIASEGVDAFNPAFDVTPPELVSAIITEKAVIHPPFEALRTTDAEGGSS